MSGYYFVITEYKNGRYGYSEKRYETSGQAERQAKIQRKKSEVKRALVCYQTGLTIDIKKYV